MFNFSKQNKTSPEVYHSKGTQVYLNRIDIENLKGLALSNARERVRLCSHHSGVEPVHEMFIVHPRGAYVRPHKHLKKIESMMVLQGEVDYVTFDEQGGIESKLSMGDYSSGKIFYNSLRGEIFHSLLIRSEWLVFLEITQGPFKREDTLYAEWSPPEEDSKEVNNFLCETEKAIM
jgi:cupin fold WbuC family metalloprotein